MNDFDPTNPHDTSPAPQASPPLAEPTGRPRLRLLLSSRRRRWAAAGAAALICSVIGTSVGLASSSSATAGPAVPATSSATSSGGGPAAGGPGAGGPAAGGGSNARSGPAAGGAVGTVSSVSTSGFTMSTAGGQKVTVNEAASTTYANGTSAASASAVTTGLPVLVLGTTNGTTITATQVTVQPTTGATTSYSATPAVPFQRGAPSAAKQDGQVPANYTEGSGTIVSGAAANSATQAALAAYPGGVVDRVVQLSNGEYEVHNIGVNWPHHVFVSQDFKVLGAN
jgi:hypothetical protein